ncbi:MAG: beta-galactosidase [Eisenbergiella sp.]
MTPFDDSTQSGESIGYSITDDPENRPVIEEYIKELASRYGQDPRILMWNVWNEAGNSGRLSRSLPMMEVVFTWLREANVMRPLTADV